MARLESQDNPKIVHALLTGKLLTFSSLATATGIPTTTLDRRLKALTDEGIISYYELAGSYGLSLWLRSERLGFKTALEILEDNRQVGQILRVFTIGYEGRKTESFIQTLRTQGIQRLIDVREVANSRKAGFSASILSESLKKYGIEYAHLKSMGSPRDAREKLHADGDFQSFSKAYEKHLRERKEDFSLLVGLAIEKPTAVMCFEKEASRCHRSIIASRMSQLGFEVKDL